MQTTRTQDCKDKVQNFFAHIKTLFTKLVIGAEHILAEILPTVIKFVEGLKMVVDNPAIDVLTAIIPSNIDNKIVEELRQHLGAVIDMLNIELAATKETTLDEKINLYLTYLRNCSPDIKAALYHKTAALLAKLHLGENHNYSNTEIDSLVQITYTQMKHDNLLNNEKI